MDTPTTSVRNITSGSNITPVSNNPPGRNTAPASAATATTIPPTATAAGKSPAVKCPRRREDIAMLMDFCRPRSRELAAALQQWYTMRLQQQRPLTPMGMEIVLENLRKHTMEEVSKRIYEDWSFTADDDEDVTYPEADDEQINSAMLDIVQQSIDRNWVAFYRLKPSKSPKTSETANQTGQTNTATGRVTTSTPDDRSARTLREQLIDSLTR